MEDEFLITKDIRIILENEEYETRIGVKSVQEAIQTLTE